MNNNTSELYTCPICGSDEVEVHGTMETSDGNYYVGDIKNGLPNGYGILVMHRHTLNNPNDYDGVYVGYFKDGVPHGIGTEVDRNRVRMAQWRRGKTHPAKDAIVITTDYLTDYLNQR